MQCVERWPVASRYLRTPWPARNGYFSVNCGTGGTIGTEGVTANTKRPPRCVWPICHCTHCSAVILSPISQPLSLTHRHYRRSSPSTTIHRPPALTARSEHSLAQTQARTQARARSGVERPSHRAARPRQSRRRGGCRQSGPLRFLSMPCPRHYRTSTEQWVD